VVARLGSHGALRFGPLAEFMQAGPVRPVRVAALPQGRSELDWLAGAAQPLCVAGPDTDHVEDLLGRALK
jgi:DNA polymerase III psi subunit